METQTTTNNIDEMFTSEDQATTVMNQMSDLAEDIALTEAKAESLSISLKKVTGQLEQMKETMYTLMMSNGCTNGHKFDNGLFLRPYVKVDVYKAKGVENDTLFKWLRENDLGDIIKEAVHFQTLSATMKQQMANGMDLPDIFNVANRPTVKFIGGSKSKFFADKALESLL